jgi:hypothetical protein
MRGPPVVVLAAVLVCTTLGGVAAAQQPVWRAYAVGSAYAFQAPQDFAAHYVVAPDRTVRGVSVTVSRAFTTGTNLGEDTYLSVETAATARCTASVFLAAGTFDPATVRSWTDSGVTYSVGTGGDGAAGSSYENIVFAVVGSSPCVAVRYMIHSMNLGAYGTPVRAYDRRTLLAWFDAIRRTLYSTRQ